MYFTTMETPLFLTVLVMTVLCASSSVAITSVDGLAGLKNFDVMVGELSPFASEIGLTKDQLEKAAELKLSSAGIELKIPTDAFLYINLDVVRTTKEGVGKTYVANLHLSLNQTVILKRDASHKVPAAITWHANSFFGIPDNKGTEPVKQNLEDLLDVFINDYLKANPR